MVRTATTLHRLLDAAPALAGDRRIRPYVTLVPGSEFDADALAALEGLRALQLPWDEARRRPFALVLAASARGALHLLRGPLALLPHGAGFGKRMPARSGGGPPREDGRDPANGLHPEQLLRPDGRALAALHALAHPSQLDRLAAHSPRAAAPAAVVGDPTLDRMLESLPRRERYRQTLGTGRRRLVVAVSTWGEESLLEQRPQLPLRLATELPHDAYQTALVLHPNEHARKERFGIRQDFTPERRAGMLLPRPYEEWAALLVAADCVISDHGSTALYAAALGLPVVSACEGGSELLGGTPMAELMEGAPRLDERTPYEEQMERVLAGHRTATVRQAAAGAFARPGDALPRLREHLYGLLGLAPPRVPAEPEPLPLPHDVARRSPAPWAFAVDVALADAPAHTVPQERAGALPTVRVVRRPVSGRPGDHLAAEADWAGLRHVQSAGLLYRHMRQESPAGETAAGGAPTGRASAEEASAAEWSADVLARYPGCRTAAALLGRYRCVVRVRGCGLLHVRIEPEGAPPDPVAVVCGVHAWLAKWRGPVRSGQRVLCGVGGQRAVAVLSPVENLTPAGDAVDVSSQWS
ncbi:UDP-N-acetyl glucosamine 2-epimerase [Streptomyces reniochalinae]|uniref:UDP-N-acetyl glucosamine 2-epimerase n=1 Tax=Streptomyces reniochalinae TaxID=2250578 RepID=UPI0011C028E1|nr:UDP-N-acetyl glucosamine 2-epimerase [Streptomyces reniochalinae]